MSFRAYVRSWLFYIVLYQLIGEKRSVANKIYLLSVLRIIASSFLSISRQTVILFRFVYRVAQKSKPLRNDH